MNKCFVIFPGAFKPVHSGHISLMEKYLESPEYDVRLTIMISKSPREGISAESSKWFLDQVFARNHKVTVMIAPDASPIKSAYDIAGQAEYGPGLYALGASSKGTDIKRAEDFAAKFSEGGKYYEPETGVKGIYFPINPEPMNYTGRGDMYEDSPISSTVVRNDLREKDYKLFRTAYLPLLQKRYITEEVLQEYFSRVSSEVLPAVKNPLNSSLTEEAHALYMNILNEGGAGGHMNHPYDVLDFTFKDLKNLISDLFAGKITDITEKLDGQNLFASVDEHGNTIFARNDTTLYEQPWYLDDVRFNPKWVGNPTVQHAFTNAAETVDKIFRNIPNAPKFFNYDDKADGIRYRYWANLEILDTQNFNVIPYADSKVSFHNFVATVFDYSEKDAFSNENRPNEKEKISLNPEMEQQMKATLQKAIDKTTKTAFKAQLTPEVIFKKLDNGNLKAQKYIDYIDNLLAKANLSDNVTIAQYKEEMIIRYLESHKKLSWIDNEVLTGALRRWIYGETTKYSLVNLKNMLLSTGDKMTKEQYPIFRDFDKFELPDVMKSIMKPLDTLFIKVGNEAIKCIQGLANAGHEKEIVSRLKKELSDIKAAIEDSDDPKKKLKLQQSLARLAAVDNELSSTEGIVFKYNGQLLKLTGAFAPLNQIFGARFFDR